ncbi:PAS domain-containing protein [Devosia sp. PTR5]|uniref:Blue-light-activated histidine kinase n=2 Tax=Devosia oryzisoli TaxID=2774138 RepID=A0A927FV07_9HYPH|nr:PAS domain-containing protein [Devosia oryzisoli]
MLDDAGEPMGSVCVVIDITDRVTAEKALARSEERLSLALGGSSLVGTWDWDVVENRVTADDRFARLYGLDPLRAGVGVPVEEFIAAIHPDDAERVRSEIEAALQSRGDYHSEYRVVSTDGTVHWIVASGRVRFNGEGAPVRFPGVVMDVSEQKRIAEALAESELRFRTLADTMPQMIWSTLPDGYHDYYNARWYEFTGVPVGTTDGAAWNAIFHPDDQERAWAVWRDSLATGEPYEIEYRLRHHSGRYRWTLGRALPIRDVSGTIVRWIGTCTDIHESRQSAQERELVAQELSHRIKNIFAVLTGIISLSARSNPEAKPFADQLRQRIHALGEAHDFVRPHTNLSSTDEDTRKLSALIQRLMRPYNEDASQQRVVFTGQDTVVDDAAATPLALLFHELATNAAKYGALSTEGGRVEISGEESGEIYRLVWREIDGPPIDMPAENTGFGTRLVGLSVEGQMRGKVERRWKAEGLEVMVEVPAESLIRSTRLRAATTS